MQRNELVISGKKAVHAWFNRDPDSMVRLFFDQLTAPKTGMMCKALAAQRKVYRCVEPSELQAISGTIHHGGIVAVVKAPILRAPLPEDLRRWSEERAPVLLLDRIGNPHNLGAIARTAAFFGVAHIILPYSPDAALPSEAAYRVAEGGMEYVTVWRVGTFPTMITELVSLGYEVIGASARGGSAIAAPSNNRPIALVLGNEETGLGPGVAAACSRLVTLPGSAQMDSLNVSVAAAVLMWEYIGRNRPPPAKPTREIR